MFTHLAAANAQVVSQALGLPALPANSPVAARQQQIVPSGHDAQDRIIGTFDYLCR